MFSLECGLRMDIVKFMLLLMLSFPLDSADGITQLTADTDTPPSPDAHTNASTDSLVGVSYTCIEPGRGIHRVEYNDCRYVIASFVSMSIRPYWRLWRRETISRDGLLGCPYSLTETGCRLEIDYVDVRHHPSYLILNSFENRALRLARGCTQRHPGSLQKWGGWTVVQFNHGEDITITLESALNPVSENRERNSIVNRNQSIFKKPTGLES